MVCGCCNIEHNSNNVEYIRENTANDYKSYIRDKCNVCGTITIK
jgi:hypothetical protein